MKLAKSILCGVAALGITAGVAVAQPYYVLVEPVTVYEETYVFADPSSDGQVAWDDSPSEYLTIIERSDTLAFAPSDADLDYTSVD